MACCVLTAYFMNRLIKACDFLDLNIINIQYNEFDDGPDEVNDDAIDKENRLITSKITLDGMTCAACVASIENAVNGLDGVERVAVSLPLSRATVVHRNRTVPIDNILSTIEDRGYGAKAGERTAQQNLELLEHSVEIQDARDAFTNAAILSSIISGLETLAWFKLPMTADGLLRLAIAVVAIWVQIVDARLVHLNAWRRGFASSLTMDTLVSLSLALGTALSLFNTALFGLQTAKVYWSSISFLTTVIVGGRLLDLILRKQSATTFAKLYQLQEKSMSVKLRQSSGNNVTGNRFVDAATLRPRDEIEIGTGSMIPCDCYILSGESLVDQSTMTGESLPISKKPGDFLMSGTQNLSSKVVAVVSKAQEDSALENLISSISTATESSRADAKADLIISRFVLIILFLALIGFTGTLSSNWTGPDLFMTINMACERAMAILASACPCALGLATPSAVMAGLDAARLRGVVVKGGFETLKSLTKLTHFVMDKTGTLTTGRLSVAESEGEFDDLHRILICAAEREEAQTHPVAQAVFQWGLAPLTEEQRRRVNAAECHKSVNDSANGVTCEVQPLPDERWYTFHAGSERLLLSCRIGIPHSPAVLDDHANQTLVHFAINQKYSGSLRLRDTVRPDASAVIIHLKNNLGLNVAMLTGDLESEAKRVSKLLGISTLSSHSLPADKKAFIEDLRAQNAYNCFAMMGDGLNDSPALGAADVGICLTSGFQRSNPSISESTNSQISDVIFTSPNLSRLPELLTIAHKTMQQSNWNTNWAITYNVIAVALAMGIAEPIGLTVDAAKAGTMMALSSVSVLSWSLWLRHDLSKVSFEPKSEKRKLPV